MKRLKFSSSLIILVIFLIDLGVAYGWYDETHLAVAKAAGYRKWYNAAGPDVARVKAGRKESYNHYFNNPKDITVTAEIVLSQADRYDDPDDRTGHLYGAIIGSLRNYIKFIRHGDYAENHMAYTVHYIGDLSQPLHHIPYDAFNKKYHAASDGIVNGTVLKNIDKIKKEMYPISLRGDNFETALAIEIARIAEDARKLGKRLKREDRNITEEEAYRQLGKSASLLKAVLKHVESLK